MPTMTQIKALALAKKQEAIKQPADEPDALARKLAEEEVEVTAEEEPETEAEEEVEFIKEEPVIKQEHEVITLDDEPDEGTIEYHLGALEKMRDDIKKKLDAARAEEAAAKKRGDDLEEILRKLCPAAPKAPAQKRERPATDLEANDEFRAQALAAGYTVMKSSTVKQRGLNPHKKVSEDEVGTPVEKHKNEYKMYLKMMQAKRDIAKSDGALKLEDYTKDWKRVR